MSIIQKILRKTAQIFGLQSQQGDAKWGPSETASSIKLLPKNTTIASEHQEKHRRSNQQKKSSSRLNHTKQQSFHPEAPQADMKRGDMAYIPSDDASVYQENQDMLTQEAGHSLLPARLFLRDELIKAFEQELKQPQGRITFRNIAKKDHVMLISLSLHLQPEGSSHRIPWISQSTISNTRVTRERLLQCIERIVASLKEPKGISYIFDIRPLPNAQQPHEYVFYLQLFAFDELQVLTDIKEDTTPMYAEWGAVYEEGLSFSPLFGVHAAPANYPSKSAQTDKSQDRAAPETSPEPHNAPSSRPAPANRPDGPVFRPKPRL